MKNKNILIYLGFFGILFFIYLPYLFHLPYIDDGLEFTVVAKVLGVAHPSGYSLYSILSALTVRILFFISPYQALVMLSFLLMMGAAGFIFQILCRYHNPLFSALVTLILFSNSQFIQVAIRPEVYALHLFLFSVILFVFDSNMPRNKKLVALSFFQGLALMNHLTALLFVIFWVPSFLIPMLKEFKFPWKTLAISTAVFFLPFVCWLYFPIAASGSPPVNWGDPKTLSGFLWLIKGGNYSDRYFLKPFVGNLMHPDYWTSLSTSVQYQLGKMMRLNLPFVFLTVGLSALAVCFRRKLTLRNLGLITYALFLLVFYFHYAIPDILDNYGVLFLSIIVGLLLYKAGWTGNKGVQFLLLLVLLVNLMLLMSPAAELRKKSPYPYYSYSVSQLPENSLVAVSGDQLNAFWHLRYCDRIREDIVYVGSNFINHSWYQSFLDKDDVHVKCWSDWKIGQKEWCWRVVTGIVEPNINDRPIIMFAPDPALNNYLVMDQMNIGGKKSPFWKVRKIR